jgi:hypothetical protein
MVRFVMLKRFEELTGYTEKAVRAKMARGVWLQDREFVKAPDGHVLMDLEGYERWVLGEALGASGLPQRPASRSISITAGRAAANG